MPDRRRPAGLPSRLTIMAAGFVVIALAVVARSAQLQLGQGDDWRARAAAQQTTEVPLPARRGTIYDRNGVPLAVSQETFGVGVAPRELDDPARVATMLARSMDVPVRRVVEALESGRVWVEWPGPYLWSDVSALKRLRGVYLQRRLQRFYPRPSLAPRLLGRLDVEGNGATGLERALDTVLAGRPGSAVLLRDHRGQTYPSPSRPATEPLDGSDVVLTLDAELQEIADRALEEAVESARASGGDVVILQPSTGEVLAYASVRRSDRLGGHLGDVFEPGSTAKVFTAAALLRTARATPYDTVDTEGGTWTTGSRTIHDVRPAGLLTLTDVIRLSSNIGISKFAERLTAVEQFEALRDFGFGTPTGVEVAGEAAGRLRSPRAWTPESRASLAMGYELAVTPLQLAAAYGALANDGVLLEPSLVREVRESAGGLRWRNGPRPVRRVIPRNIAAQLSHMLRGAVEEGTGRAAALGTYPVAGKTGTARRTVEGRYVEGRYTATFVGMFPAVEPQMVLVVKIDDPETSFYGGTTAAPVTRAILEAAIATPAVTLDRARLSRRRSQAPAAAAATSGGVPGEVTVLDLPLPGGPQAQLEPLAVPDVRGLDVRTAARALHGAGFRVRVEGRGPVASSDPSSGTAAVPGTVVVLRAERPGAR